MSETLDMLLNSPEIIDDRESVLEAVKQFCSQSLTEFKPKLLAGSSYDFVLKMISTGFGLNTSKLNKASFEELVYLLFRTRYEEKFQITCAKGKDIYTVKPASLAGLTALMIARVKKKNYYTRRFLKISYIAYAQLMKEMSGYNKDVCEYFRKAEEVLGIPQSDPSLRGNSSSNSKDLTLGKIIDIFGSISSKLYIPGYENIYEYNRRVKDAYLAMYHLFVVGPTTILGLKQKFSMTDIESKYEDEFYDYYDGTEIKLKEVNIYE